MLWLILVSVDQKKNKSNITVKIEIYMASNIEHQRSVSQEFNDKFKRKDVKHWKYGFKIVCSNEIAANISRTLGI